MPKWTEFKRELKQAGCRFDHEGGNHEWWFSPITGGYFQIPRHNQQEVPPGTEHTIRKQSGVPKKR